MKSIYLNCRLKNEYERDHCSHEHYLSSSEKGGHRFDSFFNQLNINMNVIHIYSP